MDNGNYIHVFCFNSIILGIDFGTLNHRTVGLAHEFGHVILYLNNRPYGHTQLGVDEFVGVRSTTMSKRLGYDW